MKSIVLLLVALSPLVLRTAAAADNVAASFKVIELGPNHRLIEAVTSDPAGQPLTNSITQLASGMNWLNPATRAYEPAQSEFELTAEGYAVITRAQTRLIASPNLNHPEGALDLLAADGRRLRWTVVGISLFDAASGEQVQVGAVRDSVARWVGPNELIWPDCFEGLSADLRVIYTPAETHHDVILRERPDVGLLAELGFDPEHLRLEVWTEFFEAPEPERVTTVLRAEPDAGLRKRLAEPDMVDEGLDFGELNLGSGRAFAESQDADEGGIGVAKQFLAVEGRRFLVESCAWTELAPLVEPLPVWDLRAAMDLRAEGGAERGLLARSARRSPPAPPSGKPKGEILLAETRPSAGPGVVIDFVALSGSYSGYVFSNQTYQITGNVNLASSVTFEGGAVIKFNPGTKLSVLYNTQLLCSTDPYAPVVMTARDDNTVGSVVPGSTGTVVGTYANPALEIARSSYAAPGELDRLRILHATKAITINSSYYGSGPTFRNLQVVQCGVGIEAYGAGTIKVLNALFHQVDRVFSGLYYTTVHAQHLTVHQASWFNHNPGYSTVHLVNSLLVGVANPGYYSGVSVGIESSGTGVFEAVGAGDHYLQLGSPHRNVGTSSIDGGLATRLKRLTTYAPVALTGPITQNTVLEPQAWRDIDGPDRGFHYEPADYAVNALQVQNATLTLTNGVVLATYGQNGLWLNSGAVLRSVGRPTERNYIVRFNTVMEQPLNWGGGGIDSHLAINPYHASGTAPVVECRFTDFALLAYAGSHLYTQSAGWVIGQLVLRDCGLRGGNVTLGGPGATAVELKNSLWQAVSASFFGAGSLQAHHNLFRRGYLVLDGSSGPWVMRDNVFDRCEIWDWSAVTHSHNAYVSTAGRIGVPQTGDQTLGSLTYYSRDLGRYYQHLASSLRNAGSRPVTAAGLAHYTTTSDYSKDTGLVDIGLHYVATTNGQPIDTDSDGLPDYVEDANGNLQVDPGETDWTDADTNNDGAFDGEAIAAPPSVYPAEYTCEAVLDFTHLGRLSHLEDGVFRMKWRHHGQSSAFSELDVSECLSQPPWTRMTVDYSWGREDFGSEIKWNNYDLSYYTGPVARPPTVYFPIPGEFCEGVEKVMGEPYAPTEYGTYTRTAYTTMRVKPQGHEHPKAISSVLLHLEAMINKTALRSITPLQHGLHPHSERLNEPDDRWDGVPVLPENIGIFIGNERVDGNGRVMLMLPRGSDELATPQIPNLGERPSWYQYKLKVLNPISKVRMTWAQHPNGTIPANAVQEAFDAGARQIGREARYHDFRARPEDPILPDTAPYDPDDHTPTYIEFLVPRARQAAFPAPYNGEKYWNVPIQTDVLDLIQASFANIKVVNSFMWNGQWPRGAAHDGSGGILIRHDAIHNIVPLNASIALLHEAMHLLQLHDNLEFGALMCSQYECAGFKLNRTERETVYGSIMVGLPPLLND